MYKKYFNKNTQRTNKQAGFTLVELLIATTVFSTILLLCTYGLIQVGNMMYKGRTSAHTQNMARSIIDDISQAIQYGGRDLRTTVISADGSIIVGSEDTGAFCVGDKRYRYKINTIVGDGDSDWGLIVDSGLTACSYDSVPGAGAKELLANNMSITKFSLTKSTNDNYTINITVAYGAADTRDASGNCKSGAGSQFCAVSKQSTIVRRRV
ncbi:prepilin-type N-terminal cleavage/methylation domain-containing protein [Candidatus Saccharibacteria bacterium]|nr:prepilin-type N-terminal cleavage/methylation domain-containing protein [Candidatus Saccharibacteria bacterium]